MPINPNIALQVRQPEIESPLNALARVSQVKNAISQNKLADLTLGQKQREIEQEGAFNALYRDSLNPDGTVNRTSLLTKAAQGGFGSKIPSIQKGFLETDEAQGKVNKQNVELIDSKLKQSRAFLENVTTPEQYILWHEANHKDPVLGPALAARGVTAETARASIMQALNEPGGLEKLLNQSRLGIEKFTEMNRPKIETRNLGATTETMAIDPFTGQVKVTNAVRNTQSPESAASVAATIRGQNMADARGREANALRLKEIAAGGKPPSGYRFKQDGSLEPIPGGPGEKVSAATEGERKAATLLKRLENSEAQLNAALKDNPDAAKPGLIANGLRAIGAEALANTAATSSERQRAESAQLDILDAALTLGTGAAYTREQLQGYRQSYFPQIGDTPANIADKKARLENVIEAAKIAAGRAAQERKAPAAGPKPIASDADYNALPSGAEFIDPNGNRRRKP